MPDRDPRDVLLQHMDSCLIALTDGKPIPAESLTALPPWRAVLLARVAHLAGAELEGGTVAQLVTEAMRVGGAGRLVWPTPGEPSHPPTEVAHLWDSSQGIYCTCGIDPNTDAFTERGAHQRTCPVALY